MSGIPERISEADRDRLIEAAFVAYEGVVEDQGYWRAQAVAVDAVLSELGIHVTQKEQ